MLNSGASVSLSLEGWDTRFAGGPMTTDGLMVVRAKDGFWGFVSAFVKGTHNTER